ncbi:MAG: PPC domain-containing protein [Planctomycetaceae bacterium]
MPRLPRRRTLLEAFGFLLPTIASLAAYAAPPEPTSLFPAGGGRGQTIAVIADGKFDAWPVQTWSHEPGLEIEPEKEKGKFSIRIADAAPPGIRWIRFYDDSGASSLLPFEISTLPAITESEPNDEPGQAGRVDPFPAVVDGRLAKAGDVDGYSVTLKKGQTLVASLAGHRLGSPMDAVLQVVSSAGFVLLQTDDEVGLDPQLVFDVPEDGDYIVRCFAFPSDPNSTIGFAGGERYVYRLTLTAGGFLDHVMPLATSAGTSDTVVEPSGWNLPDELKTLPIEPTASSDGVRVWHPDLAGHVRLPVLPMPCVVEAEETADDKPEPLSPPATVSGRIQPAGDRDLYRFAAKKDQTWRFRLVAGGLGSPLNPVLRILDSAGKVLSEADASGKGGRDVEQNFTATRDGEYTVSVHGLAERSGPRYFYRLEVREPTPDYSLSLASDRISVAPGKPATIAVTVIREDGYATPIEISIDGLPEGVDVTTVREEPKSDSPAKPGSKPVQSTANLTLTARDGAAASTGPITIVGRATSEGATQARMATAVLSLSGATTTHVWLTVEQPEK